MIINDGFGLWGVFAVFCLFFVMVFCAFNRPSAWFARIADNLHSRAGRFSLQLSLLYTVFDMTTAADSCGISFLSDISATSAFV
ncbi:hypothetical protein K440DRAFT_613765 [Wilcoxina mikolae CBS 423.85]|nr:hypothetical protein K440DRAFT_613765 [Wilcoxina mikolae CBS 423.85]